MEDFPGSTVRLVLRLGQAITGIASLLFICLAIEFYGFTAFCFLVTIMGLVVPWGLTMALLEVYSICVTLPVHPKKILWILILGDGFLALITLAASCSAASVTNALAASGVPLFTGEACIGYRLAATMAFLSWALLQASFLINLWILPSM